MRTDSTDCMILHDCDSQQDSQEFLHYLLQGLHEDINRITARPRHLTTEIDDNLSESQKAAEAWKRYLR
ncbi:hypothetical protein HPB52_003016 [Rhipicephalus sanguineus]|uniref:Uncharacterized protein n=1 Tax=Rhipicephalus sanguineus TaxID=34632 RepID=A0A9D4SVE8_RHISA|nr:hypothetical protein HPB52_003016 [Rhipicephalus sanguineus]